VQGREPGEEFYSALQLESEESTSRKRLGKKSREEVENLRGYTYLP
jgi:hypothetical protein